jgi:hypothetical protein
VTNQDSSVLDSNVVSVVVENSFDGLSDLFLIDGSQILSYADEQSTHGSQYATLETQLTNGGSPAAISGINVGFYDYSDVNNPVLLGSDDTDSSGTVRFTYYSTGAGDVPIKAKVGSFLTKTYSIQDYLRYDLATSDKTSSYGACITYRGSGTTTWTYSTNNGYRISIPNSTEGMVVLDELTGEDDFTIEFDVQMINTQSYTSNAIGLCAYEDNNNYGRISATNLKIAQRVSVSGSASESEDNFNHSLNTSQLIHFKYTITDNKIVEEISQGTTINGTRTISYTTTSNTKFGIRGIWQKTWAENNYFKNIKIKPL